MASMIIYSPTCISEELITEPNITTNTILKEKGYNAMLPRWNLTDFYADYKSDILNNDLKKIDIGTTNFNKKYEGKITKLNATQLYDSIREYELISELMTKISSYSYLLYSTNLKNEAILAFYQNTSEFINSANNKLLFFELELNKISEKEMNQLLLNAKLKNYKPWLDKIRSFKKYQLNEKEEQILNQKNITANNYWVKLYDTTTSNLRFPFQNQELTYAEILKKPLDKDENVRKEAFYSMTSTLNKNIELLTLITNALAKNKEIDETIRKAPSITTFRNLDNQVEDEVVNTLVSSVKSNYKNIAQRYYLLKAKWMNKVQLEPWDRNAPLPDSDEKYIQWDEAKEIILNAFHQFSPEFAMIAKKFFDNNWIDAQIYDGKQAGAYAHPTVPSVHPYLLVNYQGKKQDVMTLAHELGHGIHQFLAAKAGYLMSNTPLTLAETASIFSEQLVFNYLIKSESNTNEQKSMLAKKVEDSLNTIFRQINFYDFEYKLHTARKQGELTSVQISAIWNETTKECLGNSINFREENGSLWSAVPHFIHAPFYVYSYAFGNCLVNSLYEVYTKKQVSDFVPKYINLLQAGGSMKYYEALNMFNLNAKDPKFWQNGLDFIDRMIDQLSEMN